MFKFILSRYLFVLRTDHVLSPSFCEVLYQTRTKKIAQEIYSVKWEAAGKDCQASTRNMDLLLACTRKQ